MINVWNFQKSYWFQLSNPFCKPKLYFRIFLDFCIKHFQNLYFDVDFSKHNFRANEGKNSYIINVWSFRKPYWFQFSTPFCNPKLYFRVFLALKTIFRCRFFRIHFQGDDYFFNCRKTWIFCPPKIIWLSDQKYEDFFANIVLSMENLLCSINLVKKSGPKVGGGQNAYN